MDRTTIRHLLLIVAISATVMLTGLGASRLWDDDEPRNAGCSREMLARGDWIVPTFNGELRAHKPVLTYWCIMTSYLVLGESEFAARLPSALAAIGTTLLTYAIGRRLFTAQAALWGALILPTTMLFAMAGRIATPDSLLIFSVTLSMAAYVWTAWPRRQLGQEGNHETRDGHERDASEGSTAAADYFPRQWWKVASIYAAMGLAVLAKGPVGLVLPTAIVGMFLIVVRWNDNRRVGPAAQPPRATAMNAATWWAGAVLRLLVPPYQALKYFVATAWSMRPLTALVIVTLVASPWYLAVGYKTDWRFIEEFFFTHNIERATHAMEGHRGGIWFYPVMLLVGFFPWSIFAIPMGIEAAGLFREKHPQRAAILFLLCWVGVWLGTFSVARTKLASYATPCFPAVALVGGMFMDRLLSGGLRGARWWPAASFASLSVIGVGASVALLLAARQILGGDERLAIIGLVPTIGGLVCRAAWRRNRPRLAAGMLLGSAVVLILGFFAWGAAVVDRHQHADQLLAVISQQSSRPRIASFRVLEPSWIYYGKRPIRQIVRGADDVREFLIADSNGFVITTRRHWEAIAARMPSDAVVLGEVDYFLQRKPPRFQSERLVLVGRPTAGLARGPSHTR